MLGGALRLLDGERPRSTLKRFDAAGAVLATAAMLLLVYTIIKAPDAGWGAARTIGGLGGAGLLLAVFALNELRHENPLFPFSILRTPGLAAADATQMIAIAGFYSMFFFITLYMQDVLGYSPIKAGSAWLPTTFGVALGAGICTQLLTRTGTRAVIAAEALIGAGGVFWLSRVPLHGTYLADLLPPMAIMSLGLGAVFVGVQTAANAGVPPDKAGLAAALVNTSQQLGAALGLAIFSAIATSHTNHLLHDNTPRRRRSPQDSATRCSQRASSCSQPRSSRYGRQTPAASPPHTPTRSPSLPSRRRPTRSDRRDQGRGPRRGDRAGGPDTRRTNGRNHRDTRHAPCRLACGHGHAVGRAHV